MLSPHHAVNSVGGCGAMGPNAGGPSVQAQRTSTAGWPEDTSALLCATVWPFRRWIFLSRSGLSFWKSAFENSHRSGSIFLKPCSVPGVRACVCRYVSSICDAVAPHSRGGMLATNRQDAEHTACSCAALTADVTRAASSQLPALAVAFVGQTAPGGQSPGAISKRAASGSVHARCSFTSHTSSDKLRQRKGNTHIGVELPHERREVVVFEVLGQ